MPQLCIVPRCGHPTTGRSNKCNSHRLTFKRHGHPEQVSLKVTELEPYRLAIRRTWKANESSELWKVVHARWMRSVSRAAAVREERAQGHAFFVPNVQAAEALIKLHRNVAFKDIAETAMAVYFLDAERPHRFRDHEALRFQLVRKVRALDDLAIYKRWNHKRRCMHRVYRDLPPRVVRALAGFLHEPFAEAALLIHEHQKTRLMLEEQESQVMAHAVKDHH